MATANTLEWASLRSIDDFVWTNARFQVPDFSKEERWFHRIVSNLLYYQSNYFLSAILIFSGVSFFHPQKMITGLTAMLFVFGLVLYLQRQKVEFMDFKRRHPLLVTVVTFALAYLLVHQLGGIVVFWLGIMLPVAFIIAHATLRLRNVKNKLVNASEALGLAKRTPMGHLLNELGIEADLKYL